MIISLYIKIHNKTGLKYFGKTSKNPFKYKGSGKYWTNHIKKYGNDVTTRILGRYTETDINLSKDAILFSLENNIVESNEWANLKIENGLDGGNNGYVYTSDVKQKMKDSHWSKTDKIEHPMKGKKHSNETKKKKDGLKKEKG